MELTPGLASSAPAADALISLVQLSFGLAGLFFIALCWFFIAQKTGTKHGWLAFIPVVGMVVPWRVAQAPLWSLIVGMLSAVLFPVAGFIAIAIAIGAALTVMFGSSVGSMTAPFVVLVLLALVALLSFVGYVGIATWWAVGAAKRRGFSTWVGLLASPLVFIIPGLGQIVRLVFLGILAFSDKPF